jgi:predicted PurR-regulated permease PerM
MPRGPSRSGSQRALTVLTATVVVSFITFALYWARAIFIPLALAVFLTFILSPLVMALHRRGIGRVPSVVVVVSAALLAFGAVGLVVGRQVVLLTRTLPDHADRIRDKAATLKGWVSANKDSRLAQLFDEISDTFTAPPPKPGPAIPGDRGAPATVIVETSPSWVARAQGFLSPAAEAVGQAAFTFILVVFMLLKREDLRNRVIRLLGQGQVTTTTKAVDETSRRISRYLLVQFLLNASFGVLIAVGLLVIGVQYAPLWGFVAFLMRYVPYIGTWVGLVPPALFTFTVTDGWGPTVAVVALFLGLEALCNNVFEPLLYGQSLGLSAVAQLVATAFWAFLWGPVGLVLAWPLTTCLLVLGKYVPSFRFLNVLLGDEPVLAPRVAVYQRLAARDQDEAADIVEKELETRPAEQVFDDVLVPALSLARRDARSGELSDEDLRFITTAVREIIEEVAEFKAAEPATAADVPAADRARVLAVPGTDDADHAAVELFARLLDPAVWEIRVAPVSTLTSELLDRVEQDRPAAVLIGMLPPGGITHTRYLCKRIRQRFPDIKLVVGRWGATDEGGTAWEQLRSAGADQVDGTMEGTRTFLSGWQAVFSAAPAPGRTDGRGTPVPDRGIGTVPA